MSALAVCIWNSDCPSSEKACPPPVVVVVVVVDHASEVVVKISRASETEKIVLPRVRILCLP